MTVRGWWIVAVALGCLVIGFRERVEAFPVDGNQTTLPVATELNEDALDKPREVFRSESGGGGKSYLVNLGNLAFSSPGILGGVARQAGVSCSTCHVNGASNAKFFIPKMSTRPGNFDTTGPLFNPKADNFVLDPVRIPSLRGARYLAPYGHDGRMSSLRDFVRNVIVNEFSGPEPSPVILDAMVAYIHDIDFLPNPALGPGGRLTAQVSDAERRGEALFRKPFPRDSNLSCAGCHVRRPHSSITGSTMSAPAACSRPRRCVMPISTRRNSMTVATTATIRWWRILTACSISVCPRRISAIWWPISPRWATACGPMSAKAPGPCSRKSTISASCSERPFRRTTRRSSRLRTIGSELRELTERYPDRKNTSVSGGQQQRGLARVALKELVLTLRRIEIATAEGRSSDAAAEYKNYRYLMVAAVPALLAGAEPWSLFNPAVHDAHYAALRQVLQTKHTAR